MRSPILFTTWREAWSNSADLVTMLHQAEGLLARRRQGNQRFPVVADGVLEAAQDAAEAMALWSQGKLPPPDVGPIGEVARAIHDKAWAVLRPAAWPRWLLLERAFEDASDTNDLHFAALTLRTMCEEIVRQQLLDIDQSRFAELAVSDQADDQKQFAQVLACAHSSIAPIEMDFLNPPGSEDFIHSPDIELSQARKSLNDYVHPNFGSQVVALYPERETVARILLYAVTVAYRAFFALSWSEQSLRGGSRPIPIQRLNNWSRVVREVVSNTLPVARSLVPELEIPSALDWLTERHDASRDTLKSPGAAEILETLPKSVKNADLVTADNALWAGAMPNALLNLALARRSESLLTQEFPKGAPPVQETDRWFSFFSRSIELLLLLAEVKEASFKFQLVRQLAQGNPLAIDLCVRSLVEHRATVTILPKQIAQKWIETARRLQPGANLPQSVRDMDKTITKLLAGRRDSVELPLPFAMREDGSPVVGSVNLLTLVGDAFAEKPEIAKLYDVTSAAIHGRALRGIDLLRDRSGRQTKNACLMGLIVLDWACNVDEQKNCRYPAMQIAVMARHASRHITRGHQRKVRQVMGDFEGNFKSGRDYKGEGTRASPIVFHKHLPYYATVHRFAEQMKLEQSQRVLDISDSECFCDRYPGPDREWWFEIPIDGSPLLSGSNGGDS